MAAAPKLDHTEHHDEDHDQAHEHVEEHHAPKHTDSEGIWLMSYADMMTLLMGFFALLTSMASFDTEKLKEVGGQAAEYFGGETDKTYDQLGQSIKDVIAERGLDNQVKIDVKKTQMTITFEGTLFFDSGSVTIKENAQGLMAEIIGILGDLAKSKKILIEGHTDDIPINKDLIASNWELSGLRAGAVARLFEGVGFSRQQIMVIGWGETRPLVPNRDPSGAILPTNQAQNRRVVLQIMDKLPL